MIEVLGHDPSPEANRDAWEEREHRGHITSGQIKLTEHSRTQYIIQIHSLNFIY